MLEFVKVMVYVKKLLTSVLDTIIYRACENSSPLYDLLLKTHKQFNVFFLVFLCLFDSYDDICLYMPKFCFATDNKAKTT